MLTIDNLIKKINIQCKVLKKQPLKSYSSFKIGGPADILAIPESKEDLCQLVTFCSEQGIPRTLLGAGANVLISDQGVEGMVILTTQLNRIYFPEKNLIAAQSGAAVSRVVEAAQESNMSNLEFLYAMPGSIGGAVYMNARCYDSSISDVVAWVEAINEKGEIKEIRHSPEDFDYKRSPYQKNGQVIFSAAFRIQRGISQEILQKMKSYKQDRINKGHFNFPSAGSTFKNNRAFGQSTGQIIDSLGLKGYSKGDAQISPYHANIFINKQNASASDMRSLIEEVQKKVQIAYGFNLEPEVIYLGRW
ncbi:MAG: UDP-N-acetylmuramate dehydrogenase [Spirochaetales bacterium]|nr:UDP-N-acetylmuramate dehydrogenase [Spirochaetales bacterium]